ncbi:MAG TPA: alpha-E domain-containing protein [Polyangiaceae bacterium]|nr:alpha-E domain-containing protein [Polyangiaceae bacterium]
MILSRVAESCFWLGRYVERMESTARLLRVNRAFVLDVPVEQLARWRPVVVVSGEELRFREHVGSDAFTDGERVEEYMAWDPRNPASLTNSIFWARENARTTREIVSLEMWQTLNSFFQWMKGGQGRRLWSSDREQFYLRMQELAALFWGVMYGTMLHEEPFDFVRLGMYLERAGQTVRMIDVRYHMLGPHAHETIGTPIETAHAMALLRSCSATEPFLKRTRGIPSGAHAVDFLLHDEAFPRSVRHCLDRAAHGLKRVRPGVRDIGARTQRELGHLEKTLGEDGTRGRDEAHENLTHLIEGLAATCEAFQYDFFGQAPTEERRSSADAASST